MCLRTTEGIFVSNREKVTGELRWNWDGVSPSPNIIRVIKSKTMRWVENLVCKGKKRTHGRPRCTCEDNIKTDLEEIRGESLDWIQVALGPVADFFEHSTELTWPINRGEFFDQMSDYQLLMIGYAAWRYLVFYKSFILRYRNANKWNVQFMFMFT
jgi:hypothetical protein